MKKIFFCEDCMFFNERKLFEEYDFSIFDDLKTKIASEERVLLNNKLAHIPHREEYNMRYKKMMDVIFAEGLKKILN